MLVFGLVVGTSAAAEPRPLRIGVYENPPKLFTDEHGTPTGILIELMHEIARREGWTLSFVRCEWQACLTQLEAGELDLLPDVAHSDERSRRFDFHRVPTLHSWSQIYRSSRTPIDSILDLHGKRIAMLGGSVQEQGLRAMLRGFDIDFELVPAASPEAAFRLAQAGEADAAVASYQFGGYRAAAFGLIETPIVFMPARLFYAAPAGRQGAVLARIDEHLAAWQQDPASPYFRIVKDWAGHAAEPRIPAMARNALVILVTLGLVLAGGVVLLRRQVQAATRALVRVNRQLSATLDAVPDLLFELDAGGRYLDVHARRAEQLVLPPGELRGRTVHDVMPAEAAATCMAALREADETGGSSGRQIALPLPRGTAWFELSVAKKPGDGSGPATFVVLSRDVSPRREAEAGVQRLTRLYATLSQCNQAIVRCKGQDELLQQICRAAVDFGGMKMAWIGLIDACDGRLEVAAAHGQGIDYLAAIRIETAPGSATSCGPSGTALREDRPFWCQDFAGDAATAPWHEQGRRFGWGASAALPLHRGGAVIGVMNLYAAEVGAFDEAARSLLSEMAMDIDFALQRFCDDAERARLAAELAEREEKYRELTETINDVIWTLDTESLRFLYVSPSVIRLRGYTPEEIMAEPMDAALTPESAARVRRLLASQLADFNAGRRSADDFTIEEIEQPCRDGSTVWTEVVTNMVRNPRTGKIEIHGVTRDISERKRAEAQIRRLAHFDQLTGLPNRTLLKDHFQYALSLAQRGGEALAVMFLDLDHFKDINDSLGHDVGDQLLVEVSRRLTAALRTGDTVARLGGDEFIFILPDTGADGAVRVATKLVEVVSRPYLIGPHELSATPSIGIAMYPDDGSDMDSLSRAADAAMYQVKRDSRNGFRFFTAEMQARSARSLLLANALHHALAREQLSLHYQPQVSLRDGSIVGAEALLRWQHPELGAISPAEFIPIAEGNGLIIPLGEWVLRQATRQAQQWTARGLPPLAVAVNLSAAQFRQPDLPERVSQMVADAGLAPARLKLELTEAVTMDNPQTAIRLMERLFERGFRLSIDDFGTGYSSLSHLKRFKVDWLKIDQSFVRDITDDSDDRAIVGAIIQLARSLGMRTIAEGVETAAQLDYLREQGCDEVQGYYFSRPLAADAFEAYVRRRAGRPLPPALPPGG